VEQALPVDGFRLAYERSGDGVAGFQNNTGPVLADMLRLNLAIPPSTSPNVLGLIGGDPAGFPNGRRVIDDVVTVELRAVAGATIPLVDPSFTPRRCRQRGHRRHGEHERAVPGHVPLSRNAGRRIPGHTWNTRDVTPHEGASRGRDVTGEHSPAGQGPVLLDIGDDIRALIITMPASLDGVEIEIRPVDKEAKHRADERRHVGVVGRPANGRLVHSAVFTDLTEGRHELYERPFGAARLRVFIRGGAITHAMWPPCHDTPGATR
jgi:hypothetical protein